MPFYDFKCRRCGTTFNVQATIEEKENNKIPCPGCGGRDLERVYESAGISMISRGAAAEKEGCKCCTNKNCPHAGK
ncbi:MAG: zinc ribbon domain-containing protein [Ruminococcaceae bacterium]|nr:zinc ribbon domain-containing protein [Oscillospiraceae bacterium]